VALLYLLDEQLRGPLWQAIQHHNARGVEPLDALCVGEAGAPPLGSLDPELLLWAEANNRVLVTRDVQTMPAHLAAHLQAGNHSPGVFMLRRHWTIPLVIAGLVLHDQAGEPADYADGITYLP
jgi:hypothetical protein